MGIDSLTLNMSQDDGWFLGNDFDGYDLWVSRDLDIRKENLMLQSSHNSRHLHFIFDLFMECVKFIFYFSFYMFSLLNVNVSKETSLKNQHLFAPS